MNANTISGILFFIAFVPYIWAILQGQATPSPVSWGIWASVDTLSFFAMKKEKVPIGQITGAVIGAWIVTLLAIIFGKPTMGSIEWVSVLGATLGIVLWKSTGNAVTAIVCAQIAVLVGAVPTLVGAYAVPQQEDPIAWAIWFVSCIFALLAIENWNLKEALQPVTFTTIESAMIILVVIRPLL